MKRNNEYTQALEQARAAAEDIKARGEAAIGDNALDFIDSLLTPEEIVESDLRVSIIGELIRARQEQGISIESSNAKPLPGQHTVNKLITWLHEPDQNIDCHQLHIQTC